MNKKPINKELPNFTKGEEIFNAVSHIFGGAFGIIALILGIYYTSIYSDGLGIFSMIVYGVSMIILYTMSAIYHFLRKNKAKRVFRVFDHCTIFLLIAGTYTPVCLISLRGVWGYSLLAAVWLLAIIGIVFNAIMMHRVKVLSMFLYLLMGWCVIIAIVPLVKVLSWQGFVWLLAGGVSYTVGAGFFMVGTKVKYIHSIWHLFVLLGTILQFIGIILHVVI